MTRPVESGAPDPGADGPALLALLAAFALCSLLPPETRGESMAGCAALLALLCLLAWRRAAPGVGALGVAAALALAWPATLAARAPGAAVVPAAVALLGVAAALAARPLAPALRRSLILPAVVTGVAGAVSLHALYQKLWGLAAAAERVRSLPAVPDREAVLARLAEGRAFAAFATPAALGGFLALTLPVTVGWSLSLRGRARIGVGFVAVLQTAALLASATATATAALLAGALALLAARRVGGRKAGIAALLLLALLGGVALIRGSALLDPSAPGNPLRLRAGNFRAAWEMSRDHPWKGVGPGGFGESVPAYRRASDNESRHVHDLPLELVAENGWIVGSLLVVLFFHVFLSPLWRWGGDDPPWRWGLAAGLASFAVHNLADFTAFFPSLFWIACLLRGAGDWGRAGYAAGVRGAPLLRSVVLGGALGAAILAGLGGLAREERIEARVQRLTDDTAGSLRAARRAARLAPWDPDAWMVRAQAELAAGNPAGARFSAERAVHLDPVRPAARALRARIRVSAGDLPGAYADLAEAARLYPARKRYRTLRDAAARVLPNPAEAAREDR